MGKCGKKAEKYGGVCQSCNLRAAGTGREDIPVPRSLTRPHGTSSETRSLIHSFWPEESMTVDGILNIIAWYAWSARRCRRRAPPVQRRPSPLPPASMSPPLALAALAALLVCARAGALEVVELVFPDNGRDKTFRNDRDPPIQFPSDLHRYNSLKTSQDLDSQDHHNKPQYVENDSGNEGRQIHQNYRQDGAYESQKLGRRIILIESPDNAHALQEARRRVISNDQQDDPYDVELDRGLKHFIPNDHQDKIYNDFLKKKQRAMNEHRVKAYESDNDSERQHTDRIDHRDDRRGREYDIPKKVRTYVRSERQDKAYPSGQKTELPSACLYDGRWHSNGAAVSTQEDCLSCVCAAGALSCRRRACAPLPDPLPPRCHVRHRRSVCCPELHCPDGVQLMEHGASARSESGDMSAETDALSVTPLAAKNACVEGGSVFAAGSALAARLACEQCFCLGGARHCVRPACLAPPPHCAPRPAPGACCPQRYYCHSPTGPAEPQRSKYDCLVSGSWVSEGSPVESRGNCSACFCLRGEVRCQALGCAPALAGCRPLLAPGACCAHQYVCDHDDTHTPHMQTVTRGKEHVLSFNDDEDERAMFPKDGQIKDVVKKEAPVWRPRNSVAQERSELGPELSGEFGGSYSPRREDASYVKVRQAREYDVEDPNQPLHVKTHVIRIRD
ncbi:hypothetical protein PYW08_003514 [Mythimna loreyi]|uniref:Uncharacterized protein n=1 Tax=Mythimna loreyi TaxID=667449 RepID=A0ACC2QX26_9NEOP|nr:hypothetical protein PYW08_003514 [Mythimna loreyi]